MSATLASAVLANTMRLVASHASYAEGAPPGFSGGFKEETCHACHFHAEPNSGPGRVAIEGVPARFTAGERYTLMVTLTRAGMKRAGFQVTSRFKDSGAQAGTLAPGPDDRNRVGIDLLGGIQYAGQRKEGASVDAADAVRWTIQWTAPDGGGPVVFNVAANAADGNESADGDFVYTTTVESASSGWDASTGSTGATGATGSTGSGSQVRTRRTCRTPVVASARRADRRVTLTRRERLR